MIELNKKQKYIKKKYFKLLYHNPLHYCPISDETFKLAPHSLMMVIDLVIKILEEIGDIKWEKII